MSLVQDPRFLPPSLCDPWGKGREGAQGALFLGHPRGFPAVSGRGLGAGIWAGQVVVEERLLLLPVKSVLNQERMSLSLRPLAGCCAGLAVRRLFRGISLNLR